MFFAFILGDKLDINTVYSRYIAVLYIAELDISRSHVGPDFFAHLFREFCRSGDQERDIFREIAVTPHIQ